MVGAISAKPEMPPPALRRVTWSAALTFSLDVWDEHPLEREALETLARVRAQIESLRGRIDAHTRLRTTPGPGQKRVVYYMGQYVREESNT